MAPDAPDKFLVLPPFYDSPIVSAPSRDRRSTDNSPMWKFLALLDSMDTRASVPSAISASRMNTSGSEITRSAT